MLNRILFLLAGLVGGLGVALGAFAAHGLEAKLKAEGLEPELVAKRLHTCEVASKYHLIHAVALLGLAAAPAAFAVRARAAAAGLFVLGLLMFSGILYAQSIAGLKGFNLVVPAGGLCFILGWLAVAGCALKKS
jgi:uncharacterized membrane protein YgdD (TMEM256/DUF423 family)